MNQEKIGLLLGALNSKRTGYRSGWVEAHCVLGPWRHGGKDSHPSFGVKENSKGASICKCLSCGFGGDLLDLIYGVRQYLKKSPVDGYNLPYAASLVNDELADAEFDPNTIPDYTGVTAKVDSPLPESWLSSFKPLSVSKEGMDYVLGRGLTPKMIEFLDLRYDFLQGRVGFPFRNFKGEVMGVQGRSIDPDEPLRYFQYGYKGVRNAQCWMGEHRANFDAPLVLVEGPFDLASVLRVYPNVVASFTTGLSKEKLKRISDASEIVTLYDYGHGGEAAREIISKFFKKIPVTHLVPTKEQDDAGAMSASEVIDLLEGVVHLEVFS